MNTNTFSLSSDKNHLTVQQTISACCESLIEVIENNYISQENMLIFIIGLYNNQTNNKNQVK